MVDSDPKEFSEFNLREAMERRRRETKERENTPPPSKTGTCVACKGLVEGKWHRGLRPGVDPMRVPCGPGSRQFITWNFQGYHCTRCGLAYKFPPPPGILTGGGDNDEPAAAPEPDQGRG